MAKLECLIRLEKTLYPSNENEGEIELEELDWNELADKVFLETGHKKESHKEIVLSLVEKEEIKDLNREFRKNDYATDVLSFPPTEEGGFDLSEFEDLEEISNSPILGDIVICVDKALEQAKEYGHGLKYELYYLFVHGLLHLLGYDHENEKEAEKMFELQDIILESYE